MEDETKGVAMVIFRTHSLLGKVSDYVNKHYFNAIKCQLMCTLGQIPVQSI